MLREAGNALLRFRTVNLHSAMFGKNRIALDQGIRAAAAADAVYVFEEQKTELLMKVTEKPLRRREWLSKSTSLTSRT